MPILQVDDLRIRYDGQEGAVHAVDGISFAIERGGEALGIVGESGSGKSSLALALMRLLPRNGRVVGGQICFDGTDIASLSEDAIRRDVRWKGMAMVFQGAMNSLNPVIRVGDQVAERLVSDGVAKADAARTVAELLRSVGLAAEVAERYPHELSGGMKQRVMIAMALTHDPPLLILDEPTSALDVSIQAQVMNLLKTLKWERQIAMIFITHDLALASDLCDRIAVVYAGQIRELGPADEVLTNPRDPYTQGLLASIPRLHGQGSPAFLAGAPPDLRTPPTGCRFVARCPFAFERCAEPPPLFEVGAGHVARCWLREEEARVAG